MSQYVAPIREMRFVLKELAELAEVSALPGHEELTPDLVDAVLEEAGKFAANLLAPLNAVGDREGASLAGDAVRTATGWQAAYRAYTEAGWAAISGPVEYDGQGLPTLLAAAVNEMFKSANVAFSLCPMLTQGASDALLHCGSEALKARYLPKMIAGAWTGTMNLTEPQAGSDLSAVRCRATPQADGSFRIVGQKIFITYGEHDLAENIIHLVLARLPDAPEGVRGISLFLVPKFLCNDDGSLGARNDVRCVSLEHKLGIHASPTCVMAFGDAGGAVGYLLGEANRGLEYMFVMMNAARFNVGMEGLAVAERAWQKARDYAQERVQGFDAGITGGPRISIVAHPDVRRMLRLMKTQVDAMRALAYHTASLFDMARRHPDDALRAVKQAELDLLIPVLKGWCTETGIQVASLGIQVHGGMGYIEETGAAQFLRDARIATIYEGTTGIQANDLVGRKIARDQGQALFALLACMRETEQYLRECPGEDFAVLRASLGRGIDALLQCTDFVLAHYGNNVKAVLAGAVPLLLLLGKLCGGWQLSRAALAARRKLDAGDSDTAFYHGKIVGARFYAEHILVQAPGLAQTVLSGAGTVLAEGGF